jgi:hypothetical protein
MKEKIEIWLVAFQEDNYGNYECKITIPDSNFDAVGSGKSRYQAIMDALGFLRGEYCDW